jgi:hypothetical protein
MRHWGLKLLIVLFFFQLNSLFAKDYTITFQSRAHTSLSNSSSGSNQLLLPGGGEFIEGQYPLTAELVTGEGKDQIVIWSEFHENIDFSGGYFNLVLGTGDSKKSLSPSLLRDDNVKLSVRVHEYQFDFPLSSFPYAIRVAQAETAMEARAEDLETGAVFEQTVTVDAGLVLHMKREAWTEQIQFFQATLFFDTLVDDGFIDDAGLISGFNPFTNLVVSNKYLISNAAQDIGWIESLASLNIVLNSAAVSAAPVSLASLLSITDDSLWGDFIWESDRRSNKTLLLTVNDHLNRVGISTFSPSTALDVVGTVNAKEFFINGQNLDDSFVWKKNDTDPSKIYVTKGHKVGIKTRTPFFDLHVLGVINADEYYLKGVPLAHGFDWHLLYPDPGNDDRNDLYFDGDGIGKIGVGTSFPEETLDIEGGMLIGSRHDPATPTVSGVIQFENDKFQGYSDDEFHAFPGLIGEGRNNGIPFFVTSNVLGSSQFLHYGGDPPKMSIGSITTESQFQVKRNTPGLDFFIASSGNIDFVTLGDSGPTGSMVVGSGLNNLVYAEDALLSVDGVMSGKLLLKNGVDLRKADKNGDLFSLATDDTSIYYSDGFVGFGSNKVRVEDDDSTSNYILSTVLEIGSGPNITDIDFPTRDPVISFSLQKDGEEYAYGMGIDADDPTVFRVEKLLVDGTYNKIGESPPLFVISEGNFGMGLSRPSANLHVSGNLGLIVSGLNTGVSTIEVTDNVSMLFFDPGKTALRSGAYAETPSESMGEHSVSLGKNNSASGIFSVAIGENNDASGAYAGSLGGSGNTADGYFALAMGAKASASHDGTFVWNSAPAFGNPTTVFESVVHNQFLVNASSGVGINTSLTGVSALTVQGPRISATNFLDLGLDDTKAVDTFVNLQLPDARGKSFINSDGEFKDYMNNFDTNTRFFEFPLMVEIPTSTIYQRLETIYNSTDFGVIASSFEADILTSMIHENAISQSIWEIEQTSEASQSIWQELVDDGFVFADGTIRDWSDPTNLVPASSKYVFNPATGEGWVDVIGDLNQSIRSLVFNGDPVVATSFLDIIDEEINTGNAWDLFKANDLIPLVSVRIFEGLKQENYLNSDGSFNEFRPIELVGNSNFYVPIVNTGNVQTILSEVYSRYILRTRGLGDEVSMVAKNPNHIGIGFEDPGNSILAVSGNVSFGTRMAGDDDDTFITITNYATTSDIHSKSFSWAVLDGNFDDESYLGIEERLSAAFLLVSVDGKVGVGTVPDTSSRDIRLKVADSIMAKSFTFPTGETLSPKPAVIVWDFEVTTPDIHFTSGNVGIGTTSPNSLLELSSQGGNDPVITFDLDGTDYFTYGVDQDKPGIFKFQTGGRLTNDDALFTIVDGKFGIGTDTPSQDFHIQGTAFSSVLTMSTDNVLGFPLSVKSAMTLPGKKPNGDPKGFFLKGAAMTSAGVPWIPTFNQSGGDVIYREIGIDIGIGTATPDANLEVAGTMTASGNVIITETFRSKGSLTLDALSFVVNSLTNLFSFYVDEDDLFMRAELSQSEFNISSLLSAGSSDFGQLVLADEDDDLVLKEGGLSWVESESKMTPLLLTSEQRAKYPAFDYDDVNSEWVFNDDYDIYHPGTVYVSGNIRFAKEKPDTVSDILDVVSMGHKDITNLMQVDSTMGYPGVFYEDTTSHNAIDYNFTLSDEWVTGGTVVDITGVAVTLNSKNGGKLFGSVLPITTGESIAYGLVSDVSNVDLQTGGDTTRGFKTSAIFMGDVGIGTFPSRPSTNIYPDLSHADALERLKDTYILEVKGTVIAKEFYISDSLILATLNVAGDALIVTGEGLTGMGTAAPSTLLEVIGNIQAESVTVSHGVQANSLSFDNDHVHVNEDGFVGVGIDQASEGVIQLEISKTVDSEFSQSIGTSFNYHKVVQALDSVVTDNLTGLDITLKTVVSNKVGTSTTHKGVNIDFTDIISGRENSTANIIGLEVRLPGFENIGNTIESTPNVAVFRSGFVGVGTRTPDTDFALDINGTLRASNSTAVSLVEKVPKLDVVSLVVSDNLIVLGDTVTMNSLVSVGSIQVESLDLLAESLNIDLDIALIVTGLTTVSTLNVDGSMVVDTMTVEKLISAETGTINSQLLVGEGSYSDELNSTLPVLADNVIVSSNISADTLDHNYFTVNESDIINIGSADTNGNFLNIGSDERESIADYISSDNSTWSGIRYQVSTANGSVPASLLFLVDDDKDASDGAGILAFKPFDGASGSDLAFITSTEALRLTSSGNVGISNTNPAVSFDVATNSRFTGGFIANNNFFIDGTILGLPGMTISSELDIQNTANIHYLGLDKSIYLKAQNSFEPVPDTVGFYSDAVDNQLVVAIQLADGTTVITTNYASTFNIQENKVPFYGSNSQMSESSLNWVTGNLTNTFEVSGSAQIIGYASESLSTPYSEGTVKTKIANRIGVENSSATFRGLDIQSSGTQLHEKDTVVGLVIDVDDLELDHIVIANDVVVEESHGIKYAGLFKGGFVGIDVSNSDDIFRPQAKLHSSTDVTRNSGLIVQVKSNGITLNAIGVTQNGYVGIGTTQAQGQLSIVGNSNGSDVLFTAEEKTLGELVRLSKTGLGIGTIANFDLEVAGTVSANHATVGGLVLDEINIVTGSETLLSVAKGSDLVGVGTAAPDAQLHVLKKFDFPGGNSYTQQAMELVLATDNNQSDITGILVDIKSNEFNDIGGENKVIKGLVVDLSALNIDSGGVEESVGIFVDVSTTNTTGTRLAARFLGGNGVGMGVSTPAEGKELHVSGLIKANNFIHNGDGIRYDFKSDSSYVFSENDIIQITKGVTTLDVDLGSGPTAVAGLSGSFGDSDINVTTNETINTLETFLFSQFGAGYSVAVQSFNTDLSEFSSFVLNNAQLNKVIVNDQQVLGSSNGNTPSLALTNSNSVIVTDTLYFKDANDEFNFLSQASQQNSLEISEYLSSTTGNFINSLGGPAKVIIVGDSTKDSFHSDFSSTLNVEGTAKFTGFLTVDDDYVVSTNVIASPEGFIIGDFSLIGSMNVTSYLSTQRTIFDIKREKVVFDNVDDLHAAKPGDELVIQEALVTKSIYIPSDRLVDLDALFPGSGYSTSFLLGDTFSDIDSGAGLPTGLSISSAARVTENTVFPTSGATDYAVIHAHDSDLHFDYNNGEITANLTDIRKTAGKVPFYDENNKLSDETGLYYIADPSLPSYSTANVFRIDIDSDPISQDFVTLANHLSADDVITDFSAESILLTFDERISAGTSVFSGLKITSDELGTPDSDESIIGLYVDVDNLIAVSTDGNGVPVVGNKYAAIFTGGAVEIISTGDTLGLTSANLFVRNNGITNQTYSLLGSTPISLFPEHKLIISDDNGATTTTILIPINRIIDMSGFGADLSSSYAITLNTTEVSLKTDLQTIFGSGRVWDIQVSTPDATVENFAFQVDRKPGAVTINALSVGANGYVGMGIRTANARVHISGTEGGSDDLFELSDLNNGRYLLASKSGIGIGTDPTTAELTVGGSVSGNYGRFGGLILDEINITNGLDTLLKVSQGSELVGFGTAAPSAQLHVKKTFNEAFLPDYTQQIITINVNGTTAPSLTGLVIDMGVATANNDISGVDKTLTGFKVDMTSLSRFGSPAVNWVGIHVDVSSSNATGNRVAALFNGDGGVGIGVDIPSLGKSLDVAGTISARDFIHKGDGVKYDDITDTNYVFKTRDIVTVSASGGSPVKVIDLTSGLAQTFTAPGEANIPANHLTITPDNSEPILGLESLLGVIGTFTVSVQSFRADSSEFSSFTINHATLNRLVVETEGENNPSSSVTQFPNLTVLNSTLYVTNEFKFSDQNDEFNFLTQAATQPSLEITDLISANIAILSTSNTALEPATVVVLGSSGIEYDDTNYVSSFNIEGDSEFNGTVTVLDSFISGISAVSLNMIETDSSLVLGKTEILATLNIPTQNLFAQKIEFADQSVSVNSVIKLGYIVTFKSVTQNLSFLMTNNPTIVSLNVFNRGNVSIPLGLITADTFSSNLDMASDIKVEARDSTYDPLGSDTDYAQLYLGYENLIYKYSNEYEYANLTVSLTGEHTKVPFFNASKTLSDDIWLRYLDGPTYSGVDTSSILSLESDIPFTPSIGEGIENTFFTVANEFGDERNFSEFSAHRIHSSIAKRTTTRNIEFIGLDVTINVAQNVSVVDSGDSVIGVMVDLSNLIANSSSQLADDFNSLIGTKYAAVFNGGAVEIITSASANGGVSANLHIRNFSESKFNTIPSTNILLPFDQVSYAKTGGGTFVNVLYDKGSVAINGNDYSYTLGVTTGSDLGARIIADLGSGVFTMSRSNHNQAFMVQDTSGSDIDALSVSAYGLVGVGTTLNTAALTIKNESSSSLPFLNVGGVIPKLIIDTDGKMGLGNATPEKTLDVTSLANSFRVTQSDNPLGLLLENDSLGIGVDTPLAALHVTGNGDMSLKVSSNSLVVNSATAANNGFIGINNDIPSFSLSVQNIVLSGELDNVANWITTNTTIDDYSIGFSAGVVSNNVSSYAFLGLVDSDLFDSISDNTYKLQLGDTVTFNRAGSHSLINVGDPILTTVVTPGFTVVETLQSLEDMNLLTIGPNGQLELYKYQGNLINEVPSMNAHISYGGNENSNLIFTALGKEQEIMRLDNEGRLGILQPNPEHTLSLYGESYPIFLLDGDDGLAKLKITQAGNIGLGESDPQSLFVVSGDIKIENIIDYPGTGTFLNVNNQMLVSNNTEENFSKLTTVIDSTKGKTGETVFIEIDGEGDDWGSADTYREIAGVSVEGMGTPGEVIEKNFYGVRVDFGNFYPSTTDNISLLDYDPTFEGERGSKVAAGFNSRDPDDQSIDVLVGVSTLVPSASLHVLAIEYDTASKNFKYAETGPIVVFTTTSNPLDGFKFSNTRFGSELVVSANKSITSPKVMNSSGNLVDFRVPSEDFKRALMSISFERVWPDTGQVEIVSVRRETASMILIELEDSSILSQTGTGGYFPASGVMTNFESGADLVRSGITDGSQHYFAVSSLDGPIPGEEIRAILTNLYSRVIYTLEVGDNDYAPGTTLGEQDADADGITDGNLGKVEDYRHVPMMLSSGTNPTIYENNVLSNSFSGKVGINLFDDFQLTPSSVFNEALVISTKNESEVALRLGIWNPTGNIDLSAPAPKLYFSGGPKLYFEQGSGLDSDNSDPLFIRRDTSAIDVSTLEVSVGETAQTGESKWVVGYGAVDDSTLLGQKNLALEQLSLYASQFNADIIADALNEAFQTYTTGPFTVTIKYDVASASDTTNIYNWDGITVTPADSLGTYSLLAGNEQDQLNTNLDNWLIAQTADVNATYLTEYNNLLSDAASATIYKQILSMRAATLIDPSDGETLLPLAGFVGMLKPTKLVDENLTFKPENLLHIMSSQSGEPSVQADHMVIFENESDIGSEDVSNNHTLAINFTSISPDDSTNFMTFGIGSPDALTFPGQIQSLGAIEGNGGQDSPGVAFSSPERDYAEYILKRNPDEEMRQGDIVGIYGGKASVSTNEADNLMVISSSPIIIGNWQPSYDLDHYALIAFLGQVPVNVNGLVTKGDYIIASGLEDGTGIAVAPEDISIMQIDKILGKAWESSDTQGTKQIRVMVGFPFAKKVSYTRSVSIRETIEFLREGNNNLKETLSEKVNEREKQIKTLKKLIRELKTL